MNVLLVRRGSELLVKPTTIVRVRTSHGDGSVVYATKAGWFGVRLDGEDRVDEYASEHVIGLLS